MTENETKEIETKLEQIIKEFSENKDDKKFNKSFKDLMITSGQYFKDQGKTEKEIASEITGICYEVGSKIESIELRGMLIDVLSIGLLEFVLGYKRKELHKETGYKI